MGAPAPASRGSTLYHSPLTHAALGVKVTSGDGPRLAVDFDAACASLRGAAMRAVAELGVFDSRPVPLLVEAGPAFRSAASPRCVVADRGAGGGGSSGSVPYHLTVMTLPGCVHLVVQLYAEEAPTAEAAAVAATKASAGNQTAAATPEPQATGDGLGRTAGRRRRTVRRAVLRFNRPEAVRQLVGRLEAAVSAAVRQWVPTPTAAAIPAPILSSATTRAPPPTRTTTRTTAQSAPPPPLVFTPMLVASTLPAAGPPLAAPMAERLQPTVSEPGAVATAAESTAAPNPLLSPPPRSPTASPLPLAGSYGGSVAPLPYNITSDRDSTSAAMPSSVGPTSTPMSAMAMAAAVAVAGGPGSSPGGGSFGSDAFGTHAPYWLSNALHLDRSLFPPGPGTVILERSAQPAVTPAGGGGAAVGLGEWAAGQAAGQAEAEAEGDGWAEEPPRKHQDEEEEEEQEEQEEEEGEESGWPQLLALLEPPVVALPAPPGASQSVVLPACRLLIFSRPSGRCYPQPPPPGLAQPPPPAPPCVRVVVHQGGAVLLDEQVPLRLQTRGEEGGAAAMAAAGASQQQHHPSPPPPHLPLQLKDEHNSGDSDTTTGLRLGRQLDEQLDQELDTELQHQLEMEVEGQLGQQLQQHLQLSPQPPPTSPSPSPSFQQLQLQQQGPQSPADDPQQEAEEQLFYLEMEEVLWGQLQQSLDEDLERQLEELLMQRLRRGRQWADGPEDEQVDEQQRNAGGPSQERQWGEEQQQYGVEAGDQAEDYLGVGSTGCMHAMDAGSMREGHTAFLLVLPPPPPPPQQQLNPSARHLLPAPPSSPYPSYGGTPRCQEALLAIPLLAVPEPVAAELTQLLYDMAAEMMERTVAEEDEVVSDVDEGGHGAAASSAAAVRSPFCTSPTDPRVVHALASRDFLAPLLLDMAELMRGEAGWGGYETGGGEEGNDSGGTVGRSGESGLEPSSRGTDAADSLSSDGFKGVATGGGAPSPMLRRLWNHVLQFLYDNGLNATAAYLQSRTLPRTSMCCAGDLS